MGLNQRFGLMLGASWGLFLVTGLLIQWGLPIPKIVVLIDRSYCPAGKWHQVINDYTTLYQRHQRRQIRLDTTILFNDLAQEIHTTPPRPKTLQMIQTYGQPNTNRQAELQTVYPEGQFLSCEL